MPCPLALSVFTDVVRPLVLAPRFPAQSVCARVVQFASSDTGSADVPPRPLNMNAYPVLFPQSLGGPHTAQGVGYCPEFPSSSGEWA